MLKVGNKNYKIDHHIHSHSFSIESNAITPKTKNMIFFFLNRNHAGMQNDELKGGGRTHTKCGPAGLHIIFARFTFGNSSCGGRTYPAPSGTHNIEISILEPIVSVSVSVSVIRITRVLTSFAYTLLCGEGSMASLPSGNHPIL